MRRCLDDLYSLGTQYSIEREKCAVAIMDEIGHPAGVLGNHQCKVASLLLHPAGIRLGSATGEPHAPSAQMDEEQRIVRDQTGTCPNFLREEVSRPSDLQMRLNKLLP